MSWDIFSKSKIQYFLQKLKDKFVQKETGKGLSTNDFTNEDKALIGQTLGNNTILTTDKTPFLTRQTLNPTGFSGYVREKLIGASYAWNNQLVNGNFATTDDWFGRDSNPISVSGNILTLTTTSGSLKGLQQTASKQKILANHKYLLIGWVKSSIACSNVDINMATAAANKQISANIWTQVSRIWTNSSDASTAIYVLLTGSFSGGETIQFKELQVTDLTLAFGSTIADYLYNLSNNGGITKLRDMGCPIDKYTPYGYGLYSVKTSGKKIYGYNLLGNTPYGGGYYNQPIGTDLKNTSNAMSYVRTNDEIVVDITGAWYGHTFATPVLPVGHYAFSANFSSSASGVSVRATIYITTEDYIVKAIDYNFQNNGNNYRQDIELTEPSRLVLWIGANNPTKITAYHSIITIKNLSRDYEGYTETTYSLGNDDLRGKFDLVDGEIVASGDVKESNGEIARNWKHQNLGSINYDYRGGVATGLFSSGDLTDYKFVSTLGSVCAKYTYIGVVDSVNAMASVSDKSYAFFYAAGYSARVIFIKDTAYSDATIFKTALDGIYCDYELATPTTEQSTPFADPMSMVGATTEEYIDTRDIPCPVGAERQYMGQSEDVVEIPSSPLSDGKRILTSYVSGGKEQLAWDGQLGETVNELREYIGKNESGSSINITSYNSTSNMFEIPCDGYIVATSETSTSGKVRAVIRGANKVNLAFVYMNVVNDYQIQSLFVRKGMYCYIQENSTTAGVVRFYPIK